MAEKETTEETTGGRYLTKSYLVRNLQTFWGKIKVYIEQQIQLLSNFIGGQVDLKADRTDLDSLELLVSEKANNSALETLNQIVNDKVDSSTFQEALGTKVDKEGTKVLSDNNFTNTDKNKLDSLTNEVATTSKRGLMSATDKAKLDLIAEEATKITVDSDLDANSTNPVQNAALYAALDSKVDKENLLDPFNVFSSDLSYEGNATGDIVLTFHESTKHFKIHLESGEVIERFYLLFKDNDQNSIKFDSFKGNSRTITIPNPDGNNVLKTNRIYRFYIECFELLDSGKYEPFILKVKRGSEDPEEITASIFKN